MSQGELFVDRANLLTGNAQNVHINHCVTVKVNRRELFLTVVKDQQHQEVRPLIVIVRIVINCVLKLIKAEDQKRFNIFVFHILDTVIFINGILGFLLGENALTLFP